jgi:hypothetical protein
MARLKLDFKYPTVPSATGLPIGFAMARLKREGEQEWRQYGEASAYRSDSRWRD